MVLPWLNLSESLGKFNTSAVYMEVDALIQNANRFFYGTL